MRQDHLARLAPRCPACQVAGVDSAVALARVEREAGEHVIEGILACSAPRDRHAFPIVDGVPLLVPDLRSFIAGNAFALLCRADLGPGVASLVADCCGPGSALDALRTHVSTYADSHLGQEPSNGTDIRALVEAGLSVMGSLPDGPLLDAGCALAGSTLAVAERTGRLTLGIDLHVAMLRVAAGLLRGETVRVPRRRTGALHDDASVRFTVPSDCGPVDVWACDALAPPLADRTFAGVFALNLLDCVSSPRALLETIARLLQPGGRAVITSPYDWSPSVTPPEEWLGGWQRAGPSGGSARTRMCELVSGSHRDAVPGLRLVGELEHVPWQLRLHERSTMHYDVHLVVVEATV